MSLLDKLLQADAKKLTEKPKATIEIERLSKLLKTKAEFIVQALDPQRYADIQRNSFDFGKKGNLKELRLFEMKCLTLIDGVVEPSLKNKELLDHFSVATPKELIQKMFLSGEIEDLYNKISELSGYEEDDDETDEEIKN
jgi:hypothetical protein